MTDFRPGDRVRQDHLVGDGLIVGPKNRDDEWDVAVGALSEAPISVIDGIPTTVIGSVNDDAALVCRPVYPQHGEVVVALDGFQVAALGLAAECPGLSLPDRERIAKAYYAAREASK